MYLFCQYNIASSFEETQLEKLHVSQIVKVACNIPFDDLPRVSVLEHVF